MPPPIKRPVLQPAHPAPPAPTSTKERDAPPAAAYALPPPGPAPSTTLQLLPEMPGYTDLMDRIRAGFQFDDPDQLRVDTQLAWFARNPEYLDRVFGRAALYMHYIVEEVEKRGMPLEIALLPVIESAFEPYAYSRARAAGLWQFIPDTGSKFGLPQNWWYDGRRDVTESTRAALDYLQFLHDEFQGDWLLAIAGYNCGEGCVARAVRRNTAAGLPIDFWSLRLPTETQAYVPKLLAMKRLVTNPEQFGIGFSQIRNEPYFAKIDVESQIDLKLAAELAGVTHEELFELNPAYHRWATPPQGPHALLLPIDSAELFRQNLAQLTPDELMRVTHHIVQPGETVNQIANRYGASVMTLRMLNGLDKGTLEPGTDLRVPSGSTALPAKVRLAAARVDGPEPSTPRGKGKRQRPQVHVVRRGESIWQIAQRNKIDLRTLLRLNGMRRGDTIKPGDKLVVNANAGTSTERSAPAAAPAPAVVRHTVQRGETLGSIARKYSVTIAQIASWNGIAASRALKIGQRLTIKVKRS
jgi:membrane-bound lytic murein transglycosylase D